MLGARGGVDSFIKLQAFIRACFMLPYRQLEGFTRALNRLIHGLPSADYSWLRKRILRLNPSPCDLLKDSNELVVIAIDSSGVSVHKRGGWVERVYGKKRRYIKIHLAVDVKTKEVLAMEVTTDDFHDLEALPNLIEEASKHGVIARAYMDGAYDSSKAYGLLRRAGIKPIIKPRRNAKTDRGPPERRRTVKLIRSIGDKAWSRITGYGRRWIVETAFSTFKRQYGEYCMAKNIDNITKELMAKAFIYNMLVNL